jgi:hypothetical protein
LKQNPYLIDDRLQDLIAALQFLANYPDYDLVIEEFRKKIAVPPKSAKDWKDVFLDHPEFFRKSQYADDYSLILRRARPKDNGKLRPPLTSDELSMLIDTAIHLQKHALELRRERRALLPLLATGIGIIATLVGTIVGAMIKEK